jgi:hypothetical protein
MIKFDVMNRFSGAVQFTAELECSEDESYSVKLGLAVKWALKARANLAGAYLAGANLAGAYLADADLARANLADANLARANLAGANLADADLADANLAGAYLAGANLAGAYLAGANLADADLADADLADANLAGANLADANLADAKGIVPERSTPLLMLLDQPGKIRAYKLVDADLRSPIQSAGKLKYEIGKTISVMDANTNPNNHCAAGVNVATLDWCLSNWREGCRILIVEFEAKDIACIPTATNGKFRLFRCDVVAEKTLDLVALGLKKPEKVEAA